MRSEARTLFSRTIWSGYGEPLPRFRCVIFPSEPGQGWTGPRGRLNRKHIEQHVSSFIDYAVFLCGPASFMASMEEILTAMGVAAALELGVERFTAGVADSS